VSVSRNFDKELVMAKSAQERPAADRSASEIAFVLRRAKWRHGPAVLRDLARSEAEPPRAGGEGTKPVAKKRAAAKRGDG
jgi:hypothetical protein